MLRGLEIVCNIAPMKKVIHPKYQKNSDELVGLIDNFDRRGEKLVNAKRNSIKVFDLDGMPVVIKSFKVPNFVNQIAYKYLRKSKAERSYEYAIKLLEMGIKTPQPIAYFEYESPLFFKQSYYVSQQLIPDLTFRQLVKQPDYPEHEKILRAFTRFTFQLHENGIEFKDHSPGNTLIEKKGEDFEFSLVDLNRMAFKSLNFKDRMKNFSRLTPKREMVEVMSDEYAKLYGKPAAEVFDEMWFQTEDFQEKFQRKKRIKKRLKFWKK